ncbi:MAG: acetoin dehydrogenase dihydrolipoyllysine-residue acetyltransferase subunit [Hyphomicrobiaceae bacterium]
MTERIHAVTMPRWGMVMTEGQVSGWLANEGAEVHSGQEVVEIETTKITNVMEAAASGVLRRQVAQPGTVAPCGAIIGVIAAPDVPEAEIDAFVAEFQSRFEVSAEAHDTGPKARIVEAGAHRLNVLSLGEGGGTPIVLVHGFGGDMSSWMFNQAELAQGRIVHALDLPAHGGSSIADVSGGPRQFASAVVALLDALNIPKAHLVGHSLGGAIGLIMAGRHADRLASLTLIAPGGIGPEISVEFLRGFAAAEKRKEMKEILGLLLADPDQVSRDMVVTSLKYKRLDGVPEALQSLLASMLDGDKQKAGLREILTTTKVPAQIIWGAEDRIIPASQVRGLPAHIPVHILSNVGHMPMMEAAAEVTKLIGEHVARNGG